MRDAPSGLPRGRRHGDVSENVRHRSDGREAIQPVSICLSSERKIISGSPDPEHINTSYVERQNLSMRMGIRRFTRLTNAFSKKLEKHIHALSIYFMHYNFVRIHQTIRCSPAMQAGVTDTLWSLDDMVRIVDEWEASQKNGGLNNGPRKRRIY